MRALRLPPFVVASVVTGGFLVGAWLTWILYHDASRLTSEGDATPGSNGRPDGGTQPQNKQPAVDLKTLPAQTALQTRLEERVIPSAVNEQTSWQDAFDLDLWDAPKCRLDGSGLRVPAGQVATFIRCYRSVMSEFQIESPAPSGSSDLPDGGCFEVRLIPTKGDELLVVRVTPSQFLLMLQSDQQLRVLRKVRRPEAASEGTIRLNATGNRVMLAWDDRLMINAPQPSDVSGKPLLIQVAACDQPINVVSMRLEGE